MGGRGAASAEEQLLLARPLVSESIARYRDGRVA
jgi:hypothetical protein